MNTFTLTLLLFIYKLRQQEAFGKVVFSQLKLIEHKANPKMIGVAPTDEIELRANVTWNDTTEYPYRNVDALSTAFWDLDAIEKERNSICPECESAHGYWLGNQEKEYLNYLCHFNLSNCSPSRPKGHNCWCTARNDDTYQLVVHAKAFQLSNAEQRINISLVWDRNWNWNSRPDCYENLPLISSGVYDGTNRVPLPPICEQETPQFCVSYKKANTTECSFDSPQISLKEYTGRFEFITFDFIKDENLNVNITSPSGLVGKHHQGISFNEDVMAGRNPWTYSYQEKTGLYMCGRSGKGEFYLSFPGFHYPATTEAWMMMSAIVVLGLVMGSFIVYGFHRHKVDYLADVRDDKVTETFTEFTGTLTLTDETDETDATTPTMTQTQTENFSGETEVW